MKIKVTNIFEHNIKTLKKRFPSITKDVLKLIEELKLNPNLGISLGNSRYKVRVKNSDINRGKSGGYRIITYVQLEKFILLVTIYSKSDKDNIINEEIDKIIAEYKLNIY